MADAEFTHEGDRCTFEALVVRSGLETDPALRALGEIVHDLDIADARFERPETPGVSALIAGICAGTDDDEERRSEEHTSELQSLMRISYAVFCWTKKITE